MCSCLCNKYAPYGRITIADRYDFFCPPRSKADASFCCASLRKLDRLLRGFEQALEPIWYGGMRRRLAGFTTSSRGKGERFRREGGEFGERISKVARYGAAILMANYWPTEQIAKVLIADEQKKMKALRAHFKVTFAQDGTVWEKVNLAPIKANGFI